MPEPKSKAHAGAYRKGREAFLAGKPRKSCPYDHLAVAVVGHGRHIPTGERGFAHAWLNGYDEAAADAAAYGWKCPHCGWVFPMSQTKNGLVPAHDWPTPCRQVCPGTGQVPRSVSDRRRLWKDGGKMMHRMRKQPVNRLDPWNFNQEAGDRVYDPVSGYGYVHIYDVRESRGRNKATAGELTPCLLRKDGQPRRAVLGDDGVWYWID